MKKRRRFHLILLVPLLAALTCISYFTLGILAGLMETKATEDVAATLTATHGAEIREVVEQYATDWLSLAAPKNPTTQSRLATGEYLWSWGYARMGAKVYDEPFWLITKSATVTNLRVLEYSPERFKAIASVEELTDKITPQEEFIESLPKHEYCRLYLFVREDDAWKVADLFDMTRQSDIDRDWENNVAWEKEVLGQPIMGDLPQTDCYGHSIP